MTPLATSTQTPMPPTLADFCRSDQEVVELHLLLPRAQAQAIEAAARARGMTTGQILRRVIADLFVVDQPEIAGN